MTIRPYRPTDLPGVMATYTAAIHTLAAPYYTPEQLAAWAPQTPPDVARWQERLASLHTLVAEVGGAFAGFASYTAAGYLDFIFIQPVFARRGVASALSHRVETALRAAGVRKITAHVSLAARAFFERQGFVVDVEELCECRGAHLRRFAMHKALAGD
jgi:putative acetyltransferase